MATLYQQVNDKKISLNHVCEVGVFEPETSNVLGFIKDKVRATLIEADPEIAKRITTYFSGYPITVHPVAIWDYTGKQKLARASASTFVVGVKSSPALKNDNYQINDANTFEVDGVLFSTIDDGTIDLISIDIEGGEWYVLKHMVSRPAIISIETHGKNYVNPLMAEIDEWMAANQYVIWYKDHTDSVYSKQGIFDLTLGNKLAVMYKDFRLAFRRQKNKLLKHVRGN